MNAPLVNAVETGKNIKRLREEKGITVKELQKIFGFDTPQAIYRWQRGEILPCLDNLLVLAKILDVQVENLIIQNQIKSAIFHSGQFTSQSTAVSIQIIGHIRSVKRYFKFSRTVTFSFLFQISHNLAAQSFFTQDLRFFNQLCIVAGHY